MTDPVFREATVDITDYPDAVPSSFFADLEVDGSGHAVLLTSEAPDTKVLAWLQRQLESWSIVSGEKGPLANNTQRLTMLVRVGVPPATMPVLGNKRMLSHAHNGSLIVMDIVPSKAASESRLPVMIGGMIVSHGSSE